MAHGAEMALEAIPNTVGVPSLTGWGQGKPSRIELRVGAIHLRDLDELHPPYRVSDIQNAVLFLDKFGMNNVSVSLVYGLPGQTEASWRQTLRKALDLEPYEVAVSPVSPADGEGLAQERQRALYEVAAALLGERGLVEYAVGRFARAAGESAYVKALASGADAVGVGLGAVSCVDGMAWRNTDDFEGVLCGQRRSRAGRARRGSARRRGARRACRPPRALPVEGVEAERVSAAVGELSAWEAEGVGRVRRRPLEAHFGRALRLAVENMGALMRARRCAVVPDVVQRRCAARGVRGVWRGARGGAQRRSADGMAGGGSAARVTSDAARVVGWRSTRRRCEWRAVAVRSVRRATVERRGRALR